jgi:hypothetical protein
MGLHDMGLCGILPPFISGESWRMERILAYLYPWQYRRDIGYQLYESLISVGSGGVWGQELGQGTRSCSSCRKHTPISSWPWSGDPRFACSPWWAYNGEAMASVQGLALVFGCCLALVASAPCKAADLEQGGAAFAEGQRLFLAGDYRGALTWFKNGHQQTQDPAFLLDIAQCHRSLGEHREALMMFRLYLGSSPEGSNPQARAVAVQAIRELESEAETAAPNRPASAPAAPAAPAFETATPPGAPPTTYSARKFKAEPGGMLTPEPTPEFDAAKTAEATAGLPDTTESTRRRLRLAALASGGIGLVSIGVGIYYWTRARSLSDSANHAAAYDRVTYDDGKRAETMQWIFYGVGVAAVATGAAIYGYGRWWFRAKASDVALAPLLGPAAAGIEAHGAF